MLMSCLEIQKESLRLTLPGKFFSSISGKPVAEDEI